MFPIGEANFCSKKNTGVLINSGYKTAAAVVSDFGKGGFCCDGGGGASTALR